MQKGRRTIGWWRRRTRATAVTFCMSMMTRLIIGSLAILLAGCAHVAHRVDTAGELEPIESGFTYHTPEYQTKIRQVLFDPIGSEKQNEFLFLDLPPFEPEVLLAVTRTNDGYAAVLLRPARQIWGYDGDLRDIEVHQTVKTLPRQVAERANRLWTKMLLRARYQESNVYPDAESFCFFKYIRGWGSLGGEAVPGNRPRPALLAAIGRALVEFVNTTQTDEQQVTARLLELMDRLEYGLKQGTSLSEAATAAAAEEALQREAREAADARHWAEQRHRQAMESLKKASEEMKRKAVRYGPSGYWDHQGEYRPYPISSEGQMIWEAEQKKQKNHRPQPPVRPAPEPEEIL